MMAGKIQAGIEAALSQLLDMANEDPNSVPVLLALATGGDRGSIPRNCVRKWEIIGQRPPAGFRAGPEGGPEGGPEVYPLKDPPLPLQVS